MGFNKRKETEASIGLLRLGEPLPPAPPSVPTLQATLKWPPKVNMTKALGAIGTTLSVLTPTQPSGPLPRGKACVQMGGISNPPGSKYNQSVAFQPRLKGNSYVYSKLLSSPTR